MEEPHAGFSPARNALSSAARLPEGGTSVHLPTFRDANGTWQPAILLPEEVRVPLADAVLTFLVEEGLAQPRFTCLVPAKAG